MAEEATTKPRELNLYQKLAAIGADIGVIKKGGQNREQNYSFIEYAAVAGELRTLFAKYGIVVVPYMARQQHWVREEVTTKYGGKGTHALIPFTFVVINADKPDDRFSVTWTGEATDYGDKATNKAATSALKYYLMRQFNVSEKGEDPDAESPEHVAERKATTTKTAASPPGTGPASSPTPSTGTTRPQVATAAQKTFITKHLRAQGHADDDMLQVIEQNYGVKDGHHMTYDEAENVLTVLSTFKKDEEGAA